MIADMVDGKITLWSGRIALVLLGWFASSGYHGTLVGEHAKLALPIVEAEAGCEHWRADTSAAVAKKAINAAYDLRAPVPSANAIPQDCRHPPLK